MYVCKKKIQQAIKIEEKLKKRHKKVNNKWKRIRYQKAQILKLQKMKKLNV